MINSIPADSPLPPLMMALLCGYWVIPALKTGVWRGHSKLRGNDYCVKKQERPVAYWLSIAPWATLGLLSAYAFLVLISRSK